MATYLVDLENTGLAGLAGLEELSAKDKVIVFYGTRTGSIAFDKHVELTKAKADVTYTKTERVAKNYLDFQLVTYLGYLIGSGQERVYYIISKDKGYDSCIEFWRKTDKQITITRCESLQKQKAAAQSTVKADSGKTARGAAKTNGGKNAQSTAKADGGKTAQSTARADGGKAAQGAVQADSGKTAQGAVQADGGRTAQGAVQADGGKNARTSERMGTGRDVQAVEQRGADGDAQPQVQKNSVAESEEAEQSADDRKQAASGKEQQREQVASGKQQQEQNASGQTAAGKKSSASPKSGSAALPESMRKKIRKAVKEEGLGSGSYKFLYDYVVRSADKQKLNIALVKHFQQEKGNRLYKEIVDVFAEYHKQNPAAV